MMRIKVSFALVLLLLSYTALGAAPVVITSFEQLQQIGEGKRIGFFLGSFDPFHLSHLEIATKSLDLGYVDHVLIKAHPIDGKRKPSKPIKFRNELILRSLKMLIADNPKYAGKISILTSQPVVPVSQDFEYGELTHMRKVLGEANSRFVWVALAGSDNFAITREELHSVYMVRHEHQGETDLPYHILDSSAVTAKEFVVFRRSATDNIPAAIAGRPVTAHEKMDREGISATKIRKAMSIGDIAAAAQMVMLETHELGFLMEYGAYFPKPEMRVVSGADNACTLPRPLQTKVTVTEQTTLDAAREFVARGHRPFVLVFANSTSPCGTVQDRAVNSQEETLCRRSNLYVSLRKAKEEGFYPLNENGGILVRNISFLRDGDLNFLTSPFTVDMFVSAAYDCNTNHKPIPELDLVGYNRPASDEAYAFGTKAKLRSSLRAAKASESRILVLGALGCGAFRNDPNKMAKWYKEVLSEEEFDGAFEEVRFAINRPENFQVFSAVFSLL